MILLIRRSIISIFAAVLLTAGCGKVSDDLRKTLTAEKTAAAVEPDSIPKGMVYVPGGETRIGSEDGLPNEQPTFVAEVDPFFLDEHPVTVAQFAEFVTATGYVTEAERFGNAGALDPETKQWALVDGANWQMPLGPDGPQAEEDHPVTQVSWNDAKAYAEWADKRLPTEVEWEHAARGAENGQGPYSWGEDLVVEGRHMANTWQGRFPLYNTGEDGFMMTSPVGAFGKTSLGLSDMGGNVWEWVEDWYRPYDQRSRTEPAKERVQRGGSFLCNGDWCHGFRVSARGHTSPETSLFHVGFRCAKDTG